MNKISKIAILVPTFTSYSGIDRLAEQEAKNRLKEGNEVIIFTFKCSINLKGAKIVNLKIPKIRFLKDNFVERIYRLFFYLDRPKINKIVEQLRNFDIIICYQYPMTQIGYEAKKKYKSNIKYIYYNSGVAPSKLFQNLFERAYIEFFKHRTIKTIMNADKIISISKYLRDEYKNLVPNVSEQEYRYVEIDEKRFNKNISKERANEIRKIHHVDGPMLLYVGRISPHKKLDILIKAFNNLSKFVPNAKLVIVGKHTFDNYSKKLRRLANRNVIFTGYVPEDELPYYYLASDVYVTASHWEGFDIPIKEAQACGKPVVAFDIGAHPEVVNKRNGILVPLGDIKGFTNAMRRYVESVA